MTKVRIAALACLVLTVAAPMSFADVILTSSATTPTTDAYDQYYFGGPGTQHNSEDFTDNAGPPGQSFTTPGGAGVYYLDAVAMKGRNNSGGGAEASNWGVRVSSVSGTTLTALLTMTGITGTVSSKTDWVTFTFSGDDVLELQPNTTYAFEFFTSAGWYGFESSDGVVSPAADAYLSGVGFNTTGSARQFNSATIQDRLYDRTFYADLSVPEPATLAVLLLAGPVLLRARRRR